MIGRAPCAGSIILYPSEQLGAQEATPALAVEVVVREHRARRSAMAFRDAPLGDAVEASRTASLADAIVCFLHIDEAHTLALFEHAFQAVYVVVDCSHWEKLRVNS